MAIGNLRNRYCPCGSNKKYSACCWDKDYWEGFTRSESKEHIKEKLHGRIVEYDREKVRYFKGARTV